MSLIIEGKVYDADGPIEMESSDGVLTIHPLFHSGQPHMRPVDRCEHCGRADWVAVVYHSVAEAVDDGFLVEKV